MSLDTLIRRRTQEKELRLAGDLVMTQAEWQERGGIYRGGLGKAAKQGYYTMRECENIGQPVTVTERAQVKDFAMCKMFYTDYFIVKDGKNCVPCIPVFFRKKESK